MKFSTVQEIWNSPLNPYEKGKAIAELKEHLAGLPLAATPKVADDLLRRLRDSKTRLVGHQDALSKLTAGASRFTDALPTMKAEVETLKSKTTPDADREQLLELLLAEKRIALARELVANTSQQREIIEREVQGLLGPLNILLNQIKPQLRTRSFFGGGSAENQIALALAEIEKVAENVAT